MGKSWDGWSSPASFQRWCTEWARECLRVLKPGGHLAAFGGTRTYHRMTCAIEDAGFDVRDGMVWLHGQGFPKGKTQLKPAHEPIVLARKPLSGTVARNVLEHGTGALNVDGCRVAHAGADDLATSQSRNPGRTDVATSDVYGAGRPQQSVNTAGRWPANVLLSHDPECGSGLSAEDIAHDRALAELQEREYEPWPDETPGGCVPGCPVAELDAQSGTTTSKSGGLSTKALGVMNDDAWVARDVPRAGHDDTGGASRFFPSFRYQAKAPSAERPKVDGVAHPTVKPVALMSWLIRLVTPPGGTILDPFAGSGTTIEAALLEGFDVIGIEREPDYLPLIEHRIARARTVLVERAAAPATCGLFDLPA